MPKPNYAFEKRKREIEKKKKKEAKRKAKQEAANKPDEHPPTSGSDAQSGT